MRQSNHHLTFRVRHASASQLLRPLKTVRSLRRLPITFVHFQPAVVEIFVKTGHEISQRNF